MSNYMSLGRSSSFHILNGDTKLSFPVVVIFRIVNYINNLFPNSKLDKELETKKFNLNENNLKSMLSKIQEKSSPTRKLSDLFWFSLPWIKIKNELKEINVLDIGCGTGAYAEKFMKFSNHLVSNYIGIDIKRYEGWKVLERKYSNIKFYKYNGKNIIPFLLNSNFITTQSVLEHIEQDLELFKLINKFIVDMSKDIIQVHLVPSKACFNIFKLHGIRQYTPRTISKITKLFENKSYKILFNLGGEKCDLIHISFINYPRRHGKGDLRDANMNLYNKLTYHAIKNDMEKFQEHPSFYALLIHSNYKNRIL